MVDNALDKLIAFLERERFKGYDPYDTLTGKVPFERFGKWLPVLATQFQKRNPVNIRPFLGIKKAYNPKAMGLFLHAYSLLYRQTGETKYRDKAAFFFNWLMEHHSTGYSGMAWGYNFPWASPVKHLAPFVPSAVVTGFVCRGMMEYAGIDSSGRVNEAIRSAARFIRNDLERTVDSTGLCISYTPVDKDICFNAGLLGAEVLAMNAALNDNREDGELAIQAADFVLHRQKASGLWSYSINGEGRERFQTDFHQGYVVECLYRIMELLDRRERSPAWDRKKEKWIASIKKGGRFYFQNQFHPNGRTYWRLPKKWPADIHNQAQGIVTSIFTEKNPS